LLCFVVRCSEDGRMIKKRFFKTRDDVEVTFETSVAEPVEGVSVVCDALDWTPVPMRLVGGAWKARVRLPVNRSVQFKYLASGGVWFNDTEADAYFNTDHGENSVVDTHRPQ